VVDLENVILKSKDLFGSNQSEEVGLAIVCITNQEKTRQRTTNGLF
jgi:hypothetical protein